MLTVDKTPSAELLARRRGQAMVEFLPAVLIFITVLTAGLGYFRVMRAAAIRQEAARNLAFAKIDNAGTLTTVSSPDDGDSAAPIEVNLEGRSIASIDAGNPFISASSGCFTVIPGGQADKTLEVLFRYGVPVGDPVTLRTYAVVCRY